MLMDIQNNNLVEENSYRNQSSDIIAEDYNDNEVRPTTLAAMEREMIKKNLRKFGGNRRKAARALQISERTLYRKIKSYGL